MELHQQTAFVRNMERHFLDEPSMRGLGRAMMKKNMPRMARAFGDGNSMWYAAADIALRLQAEVDQTADEEQHKNLYTCITGLGQALHEWLGGVLEPGPSLALALKVWVAANMTKDSYLQGRSPEGAALELGRLVTDQLAKRVLDATLTSEA